jgi:hypothetical protein
MAHTQPIEQIDQLLDELEQLARSTTPLQSFLNAFINRLTFLLHAQYGGIFVQAGGREWLPIALSNKSMMDATIGLLSPVTGDEAHVYAADEQLLAVPIRQSNWARGAVVVQLAGSPSAVELQDLINLLLAFAEIIAIRQWTQLEDLVDRKLMGFQNSLVALAESSSLREAATVVVNDLAVLLAADRVSLVQSRVFSNPRPLAISGVTHPGKHTKSVAAIEEVCLQAMEDRLPHSSFISDQKPEVAPEANRGGLLVNRVCLPLIAQRNSRHPKCDVALLVEWSQYNAFVAGCHILNYLFPALLAGWLQQERWQKVPRIGRWAAGLRGSLVMGRTVRKALQWAVILGLACGGAWLLNRPIPLRIEAQGTLQPVEKRAVFATLDGVVREIFVVDGQRVTAGEPLLSMSSSSLEIQIQEVLGEIKASMEKRDGLNVAINQLNNDNADYAMQSKISSEIRELETRLATMQEKYAALLKEQERLVVVSPIDGTVVARQIERTLDARPVRRGDALLRVIKLDGPWQLELLVPDRDAGYVKRKLFAAHERTAGVVPPEAERQIEYAIAYQPDSRLFAEASWVSESARNPRGEGMFIDLHADVPPAVSAESHVGATVNAFIDCGQGPVWFVWSRPLIESIQRKLWF